MEAGFLAMNGSPLSKRSFHEQLEKTKYGEYYPRIGKFKSSDKLADEVANS